MIMNFLRNFSRILVGLLFIFSGIVKGVDPLGTTYKFGDYFLAMRMEWMMDFALPLAFLLIGAEFIIGWLLIFNIRTKLNSWFVLFFMLLFTPLTLWLAITNKVEDCGCFGDYIIMTNWETFSKNMIIMVFVLILFVTRKRFVNRIGAYKQFLIGAVGVLIITHTMVHAYRHLPRFDFRPFYKGANIAENMLPTPEIAEVNLVYRHIKTGEKFTYTAQTLPYQDTVLWPNLEFVRQDLKVIQEFKPAKSSFEMIGKDGKDHSPEIIGSEDFVFLIIMYDVNNANRKAFERLNPLIEEAEKRGIEVLAITGSVDAVVEEFLDEVEADIPYYSSDVIKLKTVVRANPGLVLIKNGYIIDKWHFNDIPDINTIKIEAPFDALAPVQYEQ